jgi:hypothetical protein
MTAPRLVFAPLAMLLLLHIITAMRRRRASRPGQIHGAIHGHFEELSVCHGI